MLVDDKLAKEKLIRILEQVPDEYAYVAMQCIELIRNTDLTDCQPQKAMNEHSSGTRAEVPPSATPSGTEL